MVDKKEIIHITLWVRHRYKENVALIEYLMNIHGKNYLAFLS